jgi:GNAT superfamily N-acetyltransferase
MVDETYTIRPARSGDLERLVELLLALQEHLEESNPGLWRMTPENRHNLKGQLAGRLLAAHGCALVAEHETDGIVGVVFGRVTSNKGYIPSQTGLLDQVFVRANHRRAGVGSRLVAELCRFFAAEGVEDISLRYVEGNKEAAAFWAALGFVPRIITAGVARQLLEERLARTPQP